MKDNKARCLIFTGGNPCKSVAVQPTDYVIACDYGYKHAIDIGITPDLAMGDFDTFTGEISSDTLVMKYPTDKDDTDTLLAIKHAISMGYSDITVYGGFGGRLDHQYANLQAAAFAAEAGVAFCMADDENMLYAISNRSIEIPRKAGYSFSLFSHSDKCENVTCRGLKYTLDNATLTNIFPIGVSNEFTAEQAIVSVGRGIAFVILSSLEHEVSGR